MPGCRAEYAVSWGKEFLSTPSAGRATRSILAYVRKLPISIHALREEGDLYSLDGIPPGDYISIHALREEGDLTAGRYC